MGKVTIDDLAIMVQKGFLAVDKKFDDLETKLNKKIEGLRFEMKAEFASVRSDIRRLENSLDEIKERLAQLEKRSFEDSDALATEVVDLRKRVTILEKELQKLKMA